MARCPTSKDFRSTAAARRMRGRVSRAFCWRRTNTFTWIDEARDGPNTKAHSATRDSRNEAGRVARGGVRIRIPRLARPARGGSNGIVDRPTCAQVAALHAQSKARHLPLHARRRVAYRQLRSEG